MQRNILFIFLFLSLCSYGQTIGDLFRSMPSGLLPGVSENNKTMLLVDTGKTVVPYAMGEVQKLRQSNDFLQIRTSAVGTTQLKMLPVAEDSVIVCLIKTVCGDICDSNITFYTTDWEILQKNNLCRWLQQKISSILPKKRRIIINMPYLCRTFIRFQLSSVMVAAT